MMRNTKYFLPLFLCLAAVSVFTIFDSASFNVFGQGAAPSGPRPEAAVAEWPAAAVKSAEPPAAAKAASAAISENIRLKDSLVWSFGGKPQRGWSLYVLLMQETLDTSQPAETAEFAVAVAQWQSRAGLGPNGIVDEKTLAALIKYWQSQRLNSSQCPSDEQLLTAPADDFYDPARPVGLLKVERRAYAAYKRMEAAAAAELNSKAGPNDEPGGAQFFSIISAFRSREYQAGLRAASPNSGRAGLAVNSPHFTGNALDLYVGGEPVSTRDDNRAIQVRTPAYRWLVKNASRFGFYPYFYEPWHWEYVER